MWLLKHVALYAKGHYVNTNDVVADLKEVLKGDDYDPRNEIDILDILVLHFHKLTVFDPGLLVKTLTLLHPNQTHTYGYYHKSSPLWFLSEASKFHKDIEEYNYAKALMMYILSVVRWLDVNKIIDLNTPKTINLPMKQQKG